MIGKLVSTSARASRKVREAGLARTLTLVFRNIVPAALLRVTRILVFEVPACATGTTSVDGAGFRWGVPNDAEQFQTFGYDAEAIVRRLAGGQRVVVAVDSSRIIAFLWFRTSSHEEEDVGARFVLSPGEVWAFEGMVRSDWRGRGVYQALLRWVASELGRARVPRLLIAAAADNTPAWRAVEKIGGTKIGEVRGIRIAGLSIVRCASASGIAWVAARGYAPVPVKNLA